jgi:hypothetical protein
MIRSITGISVAGSHVCVSVPYPHGMLGRDRMKPDMMKIKEITWALADIHGRHGQSTQTQVTEPNDKYLFPGL